MIERENEMKKARQRSAQNHGVRMRLYIISHRRGRTPKGNCMNSFCLHLAILRYKTGGQEGKRTG